MLSLCLKKANKPLAVFTANDDQAVEVVECCKTIKLEVPDDIAIVGVGNSLLAPDAMQVPISSVDTNLEAVGYHGAKLLDDMMRGIKPAFSQLQVPVAGMVVRRSSDALAVTHKDVSNCLSLIKQRLPGSIKVGDFMDVVDCSSRALHNAFKKHMGSTPGRVIQTARIEHAKRLLAEPGNHKLETVATACGYRSANSLYVTFSRTLGVTPDSYRKDILFRKNENRLYNA